eukprot:Trichotokara_eunicae@DN10028_c0_g1_i1.p1
MASACGIEESACIPDDTKKCDEGFMFPSSDENILLKDENSEEENEIIYPRKTLEINIFKEIERCNKKTLELQKQKRKSDETLRRYEKHFSSIKEKIKLSEKNSKEFESLKQRHEDLKTRTPL